jgi:hypothetical protein
MSSTTRITLHGKLDFLGNKKGLTARGESLLQDFRPSTSNAISRERTSTRNTIIPISKTPFRSTGSAVSQYVPSQFQEEREYFATVFLPGHTAFAGMKSISSK